MPRWSLAPGDPPSWRERRRRRPTWAACRGGGRPWPRAPSLAVVVDWRRLAFPEEWPRGRPVRMQRWPRWPPRQPAGQRQRTRKASTGLPSRSHDQGHCKSDRRCLAGLRLEQCLRPLMLPSPPLHRKHRDCAPAHQKGDSPAQQQTTTLEQNKHYSPTDGRRLTSSEVEIISRTIPTNAINWLYIPYSMYS